MFVCLYVCICLFVKEYVRYKNDVLNILSEKYIPFDCCPLVVFFNVLRK